MFWGKCDKAICCIEKELEHCGECSDMPCQKLRDLFDDPEHGDHGARLHNLKNWKGGICAYEKLGNAAQKKAKNLKAIDNTNDQERKIGLFQWISIRAMTVQFHSGNW